MHNRELFRTLATEFVDTFYLQMDDFDAVHKIIGSLSDAEFSQLRASQVEHLLFLMDDATSHGAIQKRAQHIGQIHALVGVSGALLTQAFALYTKMMMPQFNKVPVSVQAQQQFLLRLQQSIQIDVQTQLQVGEATMMAYYGQLTLPLPIAGTPWADESEQGLTALGQLPGIRSVLLIRLNHQGEFVVENSAGKYASDMAAALLSPDVQAVMDVHIPQGQSLIADAWKSAQIRSTPSYARNPKFQIWHQIFDQFGIRSLLVVPILDVNHHTVALIGLYGSFPNQFESGWMRVFANGLLTRWSEIWAHCHTPSPAAILPNIIAQHYRSLLFSGGLVMYAQPVVDLRTGSTTKFEVLARLQTGEGSIIAPDIFIPLLGKIELDRLFQLGLEQALEFLCDDADPTTSCELSINLAPSTLLDHKCPDWVQEVLHRHHVAPSQITLEILETQEFAMSTQEATFDRLSSLGIKLAIDDLGSGYSNFLRLSTLPFDMIKIDRGLLARLFIKPLQTLHLVGSLIHIGRDLEWEVVVEGLENENMIEAMAILGAHFGQGYGLARPMPMKQISNWKKQFVLPIEQGAVHSYLGALAYLWKQNHAHHKHAEPESLCPITRFLTERELLGSMWEQWHHRLHEDVHDRVAFDALVGLIEGQIRAQAIIA